jgi:hypothetical protein
VDVPHVVRLLVEQPALAAENHTAMGKQVNQPATHELAAAIGAQGGRVLGAFTGETIVGVYTF